MSFVKHLVRYHLGSIFGFIIFHLFSKKKKELINNQILSLYFHNPSPKLFESCVKHLTRKSFTFLSSKMLEDILINKKPINQKYVHITFDDGWKDNLKLLPVIEKYSVFITLFVTTNPVISGNFWFEYTAFLKSFQETRHLSRNKLKKISNKERLDIITKIQSKTSLKRSALTTEELKKFSRNKYVTIGCHTVNHPITITCSNEELEYEYTYSKTQLEKWTKKEVNYFAYPNGDYNLRDIDMLRKMKYKMAYNIKPNKIDFNTDLFQIPRIAIDDNRSFLENRAKMYSTWEHVKEIFFSKIKKF